MRERQAHKETKDVLEKYYCDEDRAWQENADSDGSRTRMFSCLFHALEREGIFSEPEKKIAVYCPAANKQLETRVFSSLGKCYENVSFIGGDVVGEMVHEGRKKAPEDSTAELWSQTRFTFRSGSLTR